MRSSALPLFWLAAWGGACASVSPVPQLPPPVAQTPGSSERVIQSAAGSLSAVFPDHGWQVVERLPYALKLEPADRPLSLGALADYIVPEDDALPVGELLRTLLVRELTGKVQWRVAEQGEALLGGLPAVRVEAQALVGQMPVLLVTLGRRVGQRLCTLQLTGTPALLSAGMTVFDRANDTFRCTPPADDVPPKRTRTADLVEAAERSLAGLDPSRGVALFMRASAQRPDDASLVDKLVAAERLTGDLPRALRTLKADLARHPDRFEHWGQLAQLQFQTGDGPGGLSTLKSASQRPGAPASLLAALGEAYARSEQLPESEAAFRSAIAKAPKEADLHAALADTYRQEKKLDAALAEALQAVALDPGRGELEATLSEIYADRQENQLAAQASVAALERGVPKSLEATLKYNLACFDARLGRERECLYWLRLAFEAGFNDVEYMRKDPDLASVRGLPAFRELFESQPQSQSQ